MRRWLRDHVSVGWWPRGEWMLGAGRMFYDGPHYYLRVGPFGVSFCPWGGYLRAAFHLDERPSLDDVLAHGRARFGLHEGSDDE